MRAAKNGQWWQLTPYRRLANNSAVYNDERPTMETFMTEWHSLYDSKSGERGIFSRYATNNVIARSNEFRREHFGKEEGIRFRDTGHEFGCNPCSEIILRDKEFCNLSEVVIRSTDTAEDLQRKIRLATILGTFQSTLTDFKFIGKKWTSNTEDERLLGVSLTGIMDNKLTSGQMGLDALKATLEELRATAIATNLAFSKKIGVPMAAAITCVKPSGTVSFPGRLRVRHPSPPRPPLRPDRQVRRQGPPHATHDRHGLPPRARRDEPRAYRRVQFPVLQPDGGDAVPRRRRRDPPA